MRAFRPHGHQFALWLALAAVLLRALIPDGFMLDRQPGERNASLSFCYAGPLAALRADGAVAQLLRQQGQDPAQPHQGDEHVSCAFAGAAAPGLPGAALPGFCIHHAGPGLVPAAIGGVLTATARLRPPARAPPSLA